MTGADSTRLVRWHVQPDVTTLSEVVCARIITVAKQAIAARGVFHIVLAGGNTPRAVYERLTGQDTDWRAWQVYFGDERCLPADDPERNSVMAADCWLRRVDIPAGNIHAIPAERGAIVAAREYAAVVGAARPFDVVLLGTGEDGHTASLFPGQVHDGRETVHAVHNAPKPPPERVTLDYCVLNDARCVLVLVTGAAKHGAITGWKEGVDLPVTRLYGRSGVDVYLDRAADSGSAH